MASENDEKRFDIFDTPRNANCTLKNILRLNGCAVVADSKPTMFGFCFDDYDGKNMVELHFMPTEPENSQVKLSCLVVLSPEACRGFRDGLTNLLEMIGENEGGSHCRVIRAE